MEQKHQWYLLLNEVLNEERYLVNFDNGFFQKKLAHSFTGYSRA